MIVSNGAAQGSRPYQEDYHAYYQPPSGLEARGTLLLLADGMGGMAAGSTASLMAVQYFRDHYYAVSGETPRTASIPALLGSLMSKANQSLLQAGVSNPSLWGMGTTLIACAVTEDKLYYASVGDSHLYRRRNGEMTLLNEDHSVGGQVAAMLAEGKLSPEELKSYEGQTHKLVHYLGNKHFNHFDLSQEPIQLKPGDQLIMCSDGLYGTLPDAAIAKTAAAASPKTAADALIKEALGRKVPGQDNLTVQVITFGPIDAPDDQDKEASGDAAKRPFSLSRRLVATVVVVLTGALLAVLALGWLDQTPQPATEAARDAHPLQPTLKAPTPAGTSQSPPAELRDGDLDPTKVEPPKERIFNAKGAAPAPLQPADSASPTKPATPDSQGNAHGASERK